MLDLMLVAALGFLGSFGHCVGMCGPLAVAFSLSQSPTTKPSWQHQLIQHGLLNLGRVVSYTLVGAAIGGIGSALVAGGQLAGIDSGLRRGFAIVTGLFLIWIGLTQIVPGLLPRIPLLHPLLQKGLHDRLSRLMLRISQRSRGWTLPLLGSIWGLIPCGFLYAAQIKAAETGSPWMGAATMLAFSLGTLPSMLAIGVSSSLLSADQRSQLFRMGGWLTLLIGILVVLRTDAMRDFTGHAALLCLMLALIARPISRLWAPPLQYRRTLGVGAFVLAIAHTLHMVDHTFRWNLQALSFMLPQYQAGVWMGILALLLLLPLALTSFDAMMKRMGKRWRSLHLLSVPALVLGAVHSIAIGSTYLGGLEWTGSHKALSILLGASVTAVLLIRTRWLWSVLSLEKFYASPGSSK